jgi:AcrR family transcriptional regulator
MTSRSTVSMRKDDAGRRSELVSAAAQVIARDGVHMATTRRIADQAGVPSGLVHYWFAGKDELMEEVISQGVQEIRDAVAQTSDAPRGDGSRALRELMAAFAIVEGNDLGANLSAYELTLWALRKPDRAHLAASQYQAYRQVAHEGLTKAGINAEDEPALTTLVASLFDGLVLSWLADPDGTDVRGVLDLLDRLIQTHLSAK